MDFTESNQLSTPSIFSDIKSLNRIRIQATTDSKAAIKEAAKEFEAFFMNMMLKSMRQANEGLGNDSLFSSPQEKMFIGMLDEQMSVEFSQKGNLGIADLMTRSLLGENVPLKSNVASGQKMTSKVDTILEPVKDMPAAVSGAEVISETKQLKSNSVDISINPPVLNQLLTENQKTKFGAANYQTNAPIMVKADEPVQSSKKPLFNSSAEFVQQLLPMATKVAKKIGVDPKLLLAQAALETGWGKYIMHDDKGQPSNNLFGIKSGTSWKGSSAKVDTLEVDKGTFVKVKDDFRMYDDFEKSFSDYVKFLQTNPRYESALNVVKDAKQFVESLQSAGYATDPNYAKKILQIFNTDIDKHHSNIAE